MTAWSIMMMAAKNPLNPASRDPVIIRFRLPEKRISFSSSRFYVMLMVLKKERKRD